MTVDAGTGDAYVSDTARNAIYRVPAGGAPEIWLESEALDSPNGLFLDGDRLVVAGFGKDPDGDGPAPRTGDGSSSSTWPPRRSPRSATWRRSGTSTG